MPIRTLVLGSTFTIASAFAKNDGISNETDALLTWFAPLDIALDSDDNNDIDALWGVAVSTEGYAVAVGSHEGTQGRKLWLRKFVV